MTLLFASVRVPAPRLHPLDRCAFCGAAAADVELVPTIVRATLARGVRCADLSACLNRFYLTRVDA